MDAHELHEWEVYESVYGPVGPARFDLLAARICVYASGQKLEEGVVPKWDGWLELYDQELLEAREKIEIAQTEAMYARMMRDLPPDPDLLPVMRATPSQSNVQENGEHGQHNHRVVGADECVSHSN